MKVERSVMIGLNRVRDGVYGYVRLGATYMFRRTADHIPRWKVECGDEIIGTFSTLTAAKLAVMEREGIQ